RVPPRGEGPPPGGTFGPRRAGRRPRQARRAPPRPRCVRPRGARTRGGLAMTVTWDAENVAHFLRRTGFGPRPGEVDLVVSKGFAATLEAMFRPNGGDNFGIDPDKTTLHDLQTWWVRRMLSTKGPFLEKLVLFWHNHFATAFTKLEDVRYLHIQN